MGILVHRDTPNGDALVGRIDFVSGSNASFQYDEEYLERGLPAGELGISERLPLDPGLYDEEVFGPYFKGLLPEGEVMSELVKMYQVARSDYLALLEQLGCESIGALTFVSERINPKEYSPEYSSLDRWAIESFASMPVRAAARAVSETRLSLSGAQSKVAWFLPEGVSAQSADLDSWLTPRGTAPSTHIVKVSRKGEEELAFNELACSLLAKSCGIDVADISLIQEIPGAIAIERYDRVWMGDGDKRKLLRLHQEDFCQALGLAPHFKYQPDSVDRSYIWMVADLLDSASENPLIDKRGFAKRLLFNFVIGNADAHLKNSSLLYNPQWTGRSIAPLYDVTCIPLTGYSAKMAFDIGKHRYLHEIDEKDLLSIPLDLDISLSEFVEVAKEIVDGFESFDNSGLDNELSVMATRIMDNTQPRLDVVKRYLNQ